MSKYPKMKDCEGVLLNPDEECFRFACCDCGMVHTYVGIYERPCDTLLLGLPRRCSRPHTIAL